MSFVGCALIAGGALAFASYGYLEWRMFRVQRSARALLDQQKTQAANLPDREMVPHVTVIPPLRTGDSIGRIEIPRLNLSVIVLEGDSSSVLRVAAECVRGTALPGITGNVAIAAHRDTLFRPLRDIRAEDEIVVTTAYGTYHYIVEKTEIVDPTDVQVLNATPDPELTLITCYPFNYIGPAPKRFIVHARQQSAPDPRIG